MTTELQSAEFTVTSCLHALFALMVQRLPVAQLNSQAFRVPHSALGACDNQEAESHPCLLCNRLLVVIPWGSYSRYVNPHKTIIHVILLSLMPFPIS